MVGVVVVVVVVSLLSWITKFDLILTILMSVVNNNNNNNNNNTDKDVVATAETNNVVPIVPVPSHDRALVPLSVPGPIVAAVNTPTNTKLPPKTRKARSSVPPLSPDHQIVLLGLVVEQEIFVPKSKVRSDLTGSRQQRWDDITEAFDAKTGSLSPVATWTIRRRVTDLLKMSETFENKAEDHQLIAAPPAHDLAKKIWEQKAMLSVAKERANTTARLDAKSQDLRDRSACQLLNGALVAVSGPPVGLSDDGTVVVLDNSDNSDDNGFDQSSNTSNNPNRNSTMTIKKQAARSPRSSPKNNMTKMIQEIMERSERSLKLKEMEVAASIQL